MTMSVERINVRLRGGRLRKADEMNREQKDEEEEEEGRDNVVQPGIVVYHIIATTRRPRNRGLRLSVCACVCVGSLPRTNRQTRV